ncbi:uncharacterized protein [Acropora muricata]|uniref:uncharacterized protein isoform X3 n=2 Tax=Acropora muricata TaxID=159855 RepID=UPI0034E59363
MTLYFRFRSACGLPGNMGTCFTSQADSPDSSQILLKVKTGGVSVWVPKLHSATSQADGPAGCAERTTSTTEGHIAGGETSETRTPPSSNNKSEERQVHKSAENALTTVQVPEDLGDLKDLSLNDFASSLAPDGDKLNVTLVANDEGWKITVTDQLLTELSKNPLVKLSGLVDKTDPELEAWAKKLNIKLVLPEKLIGYRGNETLSFPPDHLDIDVLIIHSYGVDLGKQAQVIKKNKKCKWVHVVHTISEELAKFGNKEIHNSEQDVQLQLCKSADLIIAIGPKVAEAYRSFLPSIDKVVFNLTPGIAHDLIDVRPVIECREIFRIIVSATSYEKYFEAKGIDIAARAINLLQDPSYHIFFLVKPKEDTKALQSNLKVHLNQKQFTIRSFKSYPKEWKKLLFQVQLAILPSRAVGFGTTILSALSAAVPVLIGGNTGLGMALKKLPGGAEYIIDSKEPQVWADKIKEVREKGVGKCSADAKQLRKEYMEKYSKEEQCHALVKKMLEMFPDKQAPDGDKLNVTLVANDEGWKITVTDQLLTELSKNPLVKLSGLVDKTDPELEAWAKKLNIKLVLPEKLIGYRGNETLSFPPDHLDIDVLIIHSYGVDLGKQAQVIKKNKKCKWVHVVHTISEELAKFGNKEIHNSEQDVQLQLCKSADLIIAIGPKVAEAYRSFLPSIDKVVFNLTPGIAHDLIDVRPVIECREIFRIMVSATSYEKYFEAKGIDIAARAINLLQDPSYHIFFLVKPKEDTKALQSNLKVHLNQKQFTIRSFKSYPKEWKKLLFQVQLAILPSRAEGFGTTILSALSAAVPVLIGGNTGLGMALKKLPGGAEYIIDSKEPQVWADKIKEVREKGVGKCSADAKQLRKEYMEKYSKEEQCHALVKKMLEMFPDKQVGRLRKSVEHVDEVHTTKEPGIQQRKISTVEHMEEVHTKEDSCFKSKIEQVKVFSPRIKGLRVGQ